MSHQRSIVHHFFPLNVQVLEKNFLGKSCFISENYGKTTLKTSILLTEHIYESSKFNCTSFFSSKCTSPREKFLKEKLFH